MSVDLDRVRTAVRAFADAAPVTAPPPAAVRARALAGTARRGRWWLVPALAAGSVLAMIAVIMVLPGLVRQEPPAVPGQGGDAPVLPERFADLSSRTVSYLESPPGPVIALYHQGSLRPAGQDNSQQLVVGADGRTYRRLDWMTTEGDHAERPWNGVRGALLSPDGSKLATVSSVIDLTSGEARLYEAVDYNANQVQVTPLAWSPDGGRIAFGSPATEESGDGAAVVVLELATGRVSRIGTDGFEPRAVAFSPSGRLLAVHAEVAGPQAAVTGGAWLPKGGTVRVYDLAGGLRQEIPLSERQGLAPGGNAWSSDGQLLALIEARGDPPVYDLLFADPTGSGRATPPKLPVGKRQLALLGWRSPTTMLVGWDDGTARGTNLIVEVPVDGGQPRTISQLSLDEHGWVTGLHLAPGLAAVADVRDPGTPARGPWLQLWATDFVTPLLVVAPVVVLFAAIWMANQRRRRRDSPGAGA
jgi:hypothetical protein